MTFCNQQLSETQIQQCDQNWKPGLNHIKIKRISMAYCGTNNWRLFRPSQSHTRYTLTNLISKCKLKINIEEIGPVIVYTKGLILKLWQIHISQFNFTPAPPISKWRAAKLKDIHKLLVWCGICHTHKQQATLRIHELCVCQSQQEWEGNIPPPHSGDDRAAAQRQVSTCTL